MTPDWAPNRIKFRDKILPFYHEQYAAVGKYGTGCIYDRIKNLAEKKETLSPEDYEIYKETQVITSYNWHLYGNDGSFVI